MTSSPGHVPVLIEIGSKKVFATALSWPGWSRSGKTEQDALDALESYAHRYRRSMGSAVTRFGFSDESGFEVVERLDGGKGTDFGVPEVICECDRLPLVGDDLERELTLLGAAWRAFDRTVSQNEGKELRKGPRGGGRDIDKMIEHVLGADKAYVSPIGGVITKPRHEPVTMSDVRAAFLQALHDRAGGKPMKTGRRTKKVWPPRYAVRRSAWHALDHAWEIGDKVIDPD